MAVFAAMVGSGCARQLANTSDAGIEPQPAFDKLKFALEVEQDRATGLKLALEDSAREIAKLGHEVGKLHEREAQLTTQLKEVLRARSQAAQAGITGDAFEGSERLVALKEELASEMERRRELEARLARLQKEPEGPTLAQIDEELDAVRQQLQAEREQRSQLEAELERLREQDLGQDVPAELTRLREQLATERASHAEREAALTERLKGVLRDRARRAQFGEDAPARSAAELELAQSELDKQVVRLKQELGDERERRTELEVEITRLREGREAPSGQAEAELAALSKRLEAEEKRRSELEGQLDRLKAETSTPPFEGSDKPAEVARLREELEAEREERTRLLAEFRKLQRRGAQAGDAGPGADSEETVALRARLVELESRQQEVMISLARTLAVDRRRENDLELQLAAATTGKNDPTRSIAAPVVPSAGDIAADQGPIATENARLQSLLEEERHRNARLAAKLKLAGRVTDLIFRMQQQGDEEGAAAGGVPETGEPQGEAASPDPGAAPAAETD